MQLPHVLPQFSHPVPCCTAKSKRTGNLCRQPAMQNGKCRFHGGKSTGAKTAQGKLKRDQANIMHGFYTKQSQKERGMMRVLLRTMKDQIKDF